MNDELKLDKCPFCNGEAEFVGRGIWNGPNYIKCMRCEARSPAIYAVNQEEHWRRFLPDAIKAWNKRFTPSTEALIVEFQKFADPCSTKGWKWGIQPHHIESWLKTALNRRVIYPGIREHEHYCKHKAEFPTGSCDCGAKEWNAALDKTRELNQGGD